MIGLGAAELLVILFVLGFVLLLMAIPATLSYLVLKRIPERHRKQKPELCFLLIIPLFSLIWQFFVFPKISESLHSYYSDKPERPTGDFGASLALWCCVCSILSFVPVIGFFSGIASLVLFILFFVKTFELSKGLKE